MNIRSLKLKDADYMLEWMHDESVTEHLHTNFLDKTIDDVKSFIRKSWTRNKNIHLAIVDDQDEYMGTVSLKNIFNNSAEFAIVVRNKAMGHGFSWFAMDSIIKKAFCELNLDSVYWCVSRTNKRAVRFYDKHNFHEALDISEDILKRYNNDRNLKWYLLCRGDEIEHRKSISGCDILHIKTFPTSNSGELSFFEGQNDIPFEIKRIYYISRVPEGVRRGFHAHKKLKQLLFCPYGRIQIVLDNGVSREEIDLSDPSIGILIDKTIWREMLWLQKDSVLCVAASDRYDPDDYIRDYNEFMRFIK